MRSRFALIVRQLLPQLVLSCALIYAVVLPIVVRADASDPLLSQFIKTSAERKRLSSLLKRNEELLERTPDGDLSRRIKLRSNIIIIQTRIQALDDEERILIMSRDKPAAPSAPSPKPVKAKKGNK